MVKLRGLTTPFAMVSIEIHCCRECHYTWWLVDGVYFDPHEWGSLYEVVEHAQTLRR